MNFTKLKMLVMTLLGISKIPVEDGKVNFDDDQKTKLQEGLDEATFKKLEEAFNKEIEGNSKVETAAAEIKKLLEETNLSEEEVLQLARDGIDSDDDDPDAASNQLDASIKLLQTKMKEKNALIEKLINDPEFDTPEEKVTGKEMKQAIKHSATHLFGDNKALNAFEGRAWNQRAAGLSTTATDFSDGSTIDKLNGDLTLFYRENPKALESLHRDTFGLPSEWDRRTKVDDRVADGTIATAEITQSRKLPWLAKNKQAIKAEEGKVFPISIDIEFVGHLLSSIETSWLNSFNKEGSQANKWSFVRFLVGELDKKARTEDRIATIKAVHVATPGDATVAGKFINRQNGLDYLAWKARDIDKKYRAFDVGVPTTANIVDYVDNIIQSLPQEVRNTLGLEFQLSPYWLKAYKRRYEQVHGMYQDYDGYPAHPKDYPNIMFQPLVDREGSNFMLVTYSKNIQILENVPSEKSMYKFETLKRIIYIFADYKMGIRFKHIGSKVKVGDPDEFKVQTVWSNSVPIFAKDFYVPVFDDTTGVVDMTFSQLQVADDFATDITKFENATPGTLIRIQGNTKLVGVQNVKDNADISLTGDVDFNLKLGGTLTLYVQSDGKVSEISRTAAPAEVVEAKAEYSTGVVDADLGADFASAHAANTAITSVVNGVEGKIIKLNGLDGGAFNVTLSTIGNIVLTAGAATLDDEADSIELILVDGNWTEINRTIA